MIQIAALVLPGTFMASVAPLLDAFDLTQERGERTIGADGEVPDFCLTLLSTDGRDVALGRHGFLRIDRAIASNDQFAFVWVPSFRAHGEAALRERLAANRPAIEWLRHCAERGSVIGASGAAVTLALAARLTGDVPVPVAAPLVPVVRALFPRFRHGADLTVSSGRNLLLSRGISHDIQAITAAFTRLFSPEAGRWIRSVFGSETIHDDTLLEGEARDPLVAAARLILEQRFSTPISIAALAAELCVSHTVLIRRFHREFGNTPTGYIRQLRLGAAQRLLLHSDRSIDSIAAAVGFGDARMFREMFRKATGLSATEWRAANRTT
ncbi:MAG: helix-turn-helix domain-containing protein [Novosphingobium sp.]